MIGHCHRQIIHGMSRESNKTLHRGPIYLLKPMEKFRTVNSSVSHVLACDTRRVFFVGISQNDFRDDLLHDLRGTATDGKYAAVPVEPLYEVFSHAPVTTVNLNRQVAYLIANVR